MKKINETDVQRIILILSVFSNELKMANGEPM